MQLWWWWEACNLNNNIKWIARTIISTSDEANTDYSLFLDKIISVWFQAGKAALFCVWLIFDGPSRPFVVYPDLKSWSSDWESSFPHGWHSWVRLRLGFKQKVWMWAWSWASQQVCAVRWQMVTPPRQRWPLHQSEAPLWEVAVGQSIHAETASFPSFSCSAFNLIPSVLQKKVSSPFQHVSHYVPRLFLQHASKPCKERSSPTVVSDLDQIRIGSHIFAFNLNHW